MFPNSNPMSWKAFSDLAMLRLQLPVSIPAATALPSVCHLENHLITVLLILLSFPHMQTEAQGG